MTTAMIDRLRRLGACTCTAAAMERRIEPALADMRNEYLEASHLGRSWRARWIEVVGVVAVVKVIVLVTLECGAESLLRPDAEIRSALLRLGAIFGAVVTVTAVALAWVPFNTTPVPRPFDARDLLYLLPQALPIAVPIGLTIAIVSGLRAPQAGRLAVWILTAAVMCSAVSLLTLGWWAPASNQAWRTRIAGREIPKGENELTLGELGTRIVEIRAFDPAAPARRLSVIYHTRWALSVTPLVLAVFALMVAGHSGRTAVGSAFATVVSLSGFALLLTWTSYLAFRGSVPPWLGAWLPNITFLGVIATLTLCSARRRDGVTRRAVRSSG
jgi:hypothetical protein